MSLWPSWPTSSISCYRRPAEKSSPAPSSRRQKLADQAVRQVFQQTATLWHPAVPHPTWAGLQLLAVDGVVWRTPDTRTMPAPLPSKPSRGDATSPGPHASQMELTSHLLTQTVMDPVR